MNVVVRSLARELARLGVEVEVMTRAVGTPTSSELDPGVILHELRAGPRGPIAKADLAEVSDEFGEAVAALAGRPASRYDIVHAHFWLSGIATLPVALELGIPFVQSFHTLAAMKNAFAIPGAPLEPERRLRSESYLAGEASAIVAGSASEATHLIEAVGAPPHKVWVIPPGVDVDFFRPNRADDDEQIRAELGIASGRPILVVAGRIQPLKDQELAVRILSRLHARRGWAPVLVIAGEATPGDEDYEKRVRLVAAELGAEDDVRFVGAQSRDSLARLFAVAALTLVTSRSETFGLVALESAASGTPVVGLRGSGLLESIAEGVSGVFVDSRDPEDWASAIAALLDDAAELGRMSATARDHALGYTWAASATALLGVYGSL